MTRLPFCWQRFSSALCYPPLCFCCVLGSVTQPARKAMKTRFHPYKKGAINLERCVCRDAIYVFYFKLHMLVFVSLCSDLFSAVLNPGLCIPGNYFPRCPHGPAQRESVREHRRMRGGGSPATSPLLSASDGVWEHLVHTASPCCTTPSPWFQIPSGGPAPGCLLSVSVAPGLSLASCCALAPQLPHRLIKLPR